MFVEQSATRLWRVRTAFVLLCLLPAVGLGLWALRRHSAAHRLQVVEAAARQLGIEVSCGGVSHPRPGCLRLTDLRLGAWPLGRVDVETTATEVRFRIDRACCEPTAVPMLLAIGNRWLTEPGRFPRNAVIEIGSLSWGGDVAGDEIARSLRVECAAAGGGRGIRVTSPGVTADEVRVVRSVAASTRPGRGRWEVAATLTEPVPAAVVIAALEQSPLAGWQLGRQATMTGVIAAAAGESGWAGEARGSLQRVDLAAISAAFPQRAEGLASLELESLVWADNRMTAADLRLASPRGAIAQEWLDGLISIIGCRASPAALDRSTEGLREFERLALQVACDRGGVQLRAEPQRAGCLVESQGLPLVFEPQGKVTLDRVAWLLSGTRTAAVPGTAISGWILSVLPLPQTRQ